MHEAVREITNGQVMHRLREQRKVPGSRKRCITCPFVISRTSVTGPKSSLNITDHFDCTTPVIAFSVLNVTSCISGKLAAV